MRNRPLSLLILSLPAFACQRSSVAKFSYNVGDAGAVDAGPVGGQDSGLEEVRNYHLCPADAGPPSVEAGGLIWRSEILPEVTPPQDAGWVALSTDPECAPVTPGSVPPRLAWNVNDGGAACEPARVDGQGDLGVDWLNATGITESFFSADGSRASAVHDGNEKALTPEAARSFSVGSNGFVLVSRVFEPSCYFVRSLDGAGNAVGLPLQSGTRYDEDLAMLFPNPLGGFVEVRETSDGQFGKDVTTTLDVRFVDAAFRPLGDWYTVVTHHQENVSWALGVDEKGRALVLAFIFPPSVGPPPPPSEWTFTARWIGPGGPLTQDFRPAAPTLTPKLPDGSDGSPLFAGWGTFLSLPGGGFAMYQGQVKPSQGIISPSRWYAFYPSGESGSHDVPGWLQAYRGSLRMLLGGVGYASLQYNDPKSCARTVLLSAPSGRACFKLDLAGSGSCAAFPDAIWPDGTLVVQGDAQSICKIWWWPGLARPAH